MPLQELQNATTSNEFLEWQAFWELSLNDHETLHRYLAQIALEIRRSYTKKSNKTLKDFLITYKEPAPRTKKAKKPITLSERKKHINKSKAAWFAAVGLDPKGKKIKTKSK